ncbi:hypothetical protein TSOC_014343, partial [Tetrabaena socialis]
MHGSCYMQLVRPQLRLGDEAGPARAGVSTRAQGPAVAQPVPSQPAAKRQRVESSAVVGVDRPAPARETRRAAAQAQACGVLREAATQFPAGLPLPATWHLQPPAIAEALPCADRLAGPGAAAEEGSPLPAAAAAQGGAALAELYFKELVHGQPPAIGAALPCAERLAGPGAAAGEGPPLPAAAAAQGQLPNGPPLEQQAGQSTMKGQPQPYTGVSRDPSKAANGRLWRARSPVLGKERWFLGLYGTQHAAALAVNLFMQSLAVMLRGRIPLPSPPNAVPASCSLEASESWGVERKASEAALFLALEAVDAARAQRTEERPAVASFVAARAALQSDADLQKLLDELVVCIANGTLKPQDMFLSYILYGAHNKAVMMAGRPTAARWPEALGRLFALAIVQRSGEAALNVMRGDVDDPCLVFPSTSTCRRTIDDATPHRAECQGISEAGVAAFLDHCSRDGKPRQVCLSADGTDIKVGYATPSPQHGQR